MEDLVTKQLRKRFVKDFNLPIQVIQDPYFTERIELCGAIQDYNNLIEYIESNYGGSYRAFLDAYAQIRDEIVTSCYNSEAFKKFNNSDIKAVHPLVPQRNLYTEEQDGNSFVSVDLKKANFQALKYVNSEIVLNTDTYEDFIGKFTDSEYIKKSKYTRQVIFGKLNPKKTINIEKRIINEIYKTLNDKFNLTDYLEPYSMCTDEIIYKVKNNDNNVLTDLLCDKSLMMMEQIIKDTLGFEVRINYFTLKLHQFKLATSEAKVNAFTKLNQVTNEVSYACIPSTYYPQIYKLINGLDVTNNDLVFYYEHELATFLNPLVKVNNNNNEI